MKALTFTIVNAEKMLGLEKVHCLNALHRLKKNHLIFSPAKGFYLIVPPEYQAYGCLPADMFIPDLMRHWNLPYYVFVKRASTIRLFVCKFSLMIFYFLNKNT
jgi:hypothetical protein